MINFLAELNLLSTNIYLIPGEDSNTQIGIRDNNNIKNKGLDNKPNGIRF